MFSEPAAPASPAIRSTRYPSEIPIRVPPIIPERADPGGPNRRGHLHPGADPVRDALPEPAAASGRLRVHLREHVQPGQGGLLNGSRIAVREEGQR